MLTARRMRERQEAEATGAPPPPPRQRRHDIPWFEHEAALKNLEERLRAELAKAPATLEIKFDEEPFKSAVAGLVAEFEQRAAEVVAQVERLEAWRAALLPEGHERPTLEAFVKAGYAAEAFDEHMAKWEHELVHEANLKRIAELEGKVSELEGVNKALAQQLEQAPAAQPAGGAVARAGDLVEAGGTGGTVLLGEASKPADLPPPAESEAAKASAKGGKKPGDKPSK